MEKVIVKTSAQYKEEMRLADKKYECPECGDTVCCWTEVKEKTKWYKPAKKYLVYKCFCGCEYKIIK